MNALFVFLFHEAPQQFQDLSTNVGDEDWLIVCDESNESSGQYLAERLQVSGFDRYEINTEVRWVGKPVDTLDHIVFITNHA